MLARWSALELAELGLLFSMDFYEPMGIDITNPDGSVKTSGELQAEQLQKDLEREARAGLRK